MSKTKLFPRWEGCKILSGWCVQPKPRVGSFSYSILSTAHVFLNLSSLIVKGTKHFPLNLFYLCLFATQQVLFSSKGSILRLYGERNNCCIGAKVTDFGTF